MGKIRVVIEGEFEDNVEPDDVESYERLMETLVGWDIISEEEI